MKICNIKDNAKFFSALSECKGDVTLVVNDKIRNDLIKNGQKTELMKEAMFVSSMGGNKKMKDLDLKFSNQEDIHIMFNYLMSA